MKSQLLFCTILAALVGAFLLPPTANAQSAKFRRTANGVEGRYIVVLNEKFVDRSAAGPAIESEAAYLTAVYGGKTRETFADALKGFVVEFSEREAIELSKDERVRFIEQDAYVTASAAEPAASWGLDRVDQRLLPLNSQYSWTTSASNVHAYVIDSGIRPTHTQFGGRATADYDALTDGQNGVDCYGHGTHVAGTVGSSTYGVAKNVRIHGVRVLPCTGTGLVSHVIMGINWVTANHIKPAVANISITISAPSAATDTAIQNSINAGVTYVVAAGNSNLNACDFSPSRATNAITVGALNSDDSKAGYSNWGACVDVWAPGTSILSLAIGDDNGLRWMSGTSMASPHVAGIAALYLSANPTASPAQVAAAITSTASNGLVTGLDGASPNKVAYSHLGSAPPAPEPARVTIRKRTTGPLGESMPVAFPYQAANLSTSNFTLQPDNEFVDPNVTTTGSSIVVTEAAVAGWRLTSIVCTEDQGLTNSVVDINNRSATIVAEQGENVDCTFTSEMLAPTAAAAEVGGRVLYSDGRAARGVTISLYNGSTGEVKYVSTNTFGVYRFRNVATGEFYILTANSTRRSPVAHNTRTFTLMSNLDGVDFRITR